MRIKIAIQSAGSVVVRNTVLKLNVNPFDTEGGKMPLSLYRQKGDLLVGRGDSNPGVVPIGSDGQVLVADSTTESGTRWKVMRLGTTSLLNDESLAVTNGTVVTTEGVSAGRFRIAKAADTQNLFVAAENIMSGEIGVIYTVSGTSCTVKVTEGAVSSGDKLTVSATDGLGVVTTGTDYFAQAVSAKAAGLVGYVTCILVNTYKSTLTISEGGTGGTDEESARNNLGITALINAINSSISSINSKVQGIISDTAAKFNASTGHRHNGTDSKKVEYSTLTGLPVLTAAAIGALPVNPRSIEMKPPSGAADGGFIDFHYGGSTADYTARVVEYPQGVLSVSGAVQPGKSTDLGATGVKRIRAGTGAMTPGVSGLATGDIYLQYE